MKKHARGEIGIAAILTLAQLVLVTAAPAEDDGEAARVALAEQLLDSTLTDTVLDQTLAGFTGSVDQMHAKLYSDLVDEIPFKSPEQRAVFRASYEESRTRLRDLFRRLYTEQLDLTAISKRIYTPIYARHLTETELRESVAFYQSATGQAVLVKMPVVLGEAIQQLVLEITPAVQTMVVEALAEERELLFAQHSAAD